MAMSMPVRLPCSSSKCHGALVLPVPTTQVAAVEHGAQQAALGRLGVGLAHVERAAAARADEAGGDQPGAAGAEERTAVLLFVHGRLPRMADGCAVILPPVRGRCKDRPEQREAAMALDGRAIWKRRRCWSTSTGSRPISRRAQAYADAHGLRLRPHIKTHKIPELARRQVELGAIGITCQKLGEAEVMADAGIDDILLTFNMLGPRQDGAARGAGAAGAG